MTDPAAPAAAVSATDAFNYLSVLLSIILGLAITQVLKGFRGLALSRARVVVYWPTIALSILVLVAAVQMWWSMFGMRDIQVWTFAKFAIVLLQITTFYLLAGLVLPDFFGEQPVALRDHYYAHHRLFFGLFVMTLVVSLLKDVVLSGHMTDNINLGFHCMFIAMSLAGAWSAREWLHKSICIAGLVGFAAYIVTLFRELR